MAANRDIVVRLKAEVAGFKSAMAEAAQAAQKTKKASEETGTSADTAMGKLVKSASQHKDAWNTAGNAMLGFGAAAVAGIGLAISRAAEFDSAMAEVRASTHESAANMDLLRTAAVNAGADTAFSAKEAAQGIDELAKAGVSTKDILNGGLTGALSLAAAGSLEVGDAAELAATALTQFKLQGKDIPHVADLLAAGAGKAQGSVEDIGGALKQSGLVASQFGISVEETVGSLAAFASAGLTGSDAGTSLKSALLKLAAPSKEAAGLMSDLGINAYDASGKFVGMQDLAGQLQDKMSGLTQAQRDSALATIFGTDAIRVANVLYSQGSQGIADWTDKVNDAGYAAATASIKQDTLAGDLEKLGGSFDSVLIKGGSGAAEALRGIVQGAEGLIDAIGKIPGPVLDTGLAIAGVAGGAALLGGAFLKVVPAVVDSVTAFKNLGTEGSKLPGTLGKVAKAAGAVAAVVGGIQILGAIFTEKQTKSVEEYANGILKVSKASNDISGLDSVFSGFDKAFNIPTSEIDSAAAAIEKLTHQDFNDSANKWFDGLTNGILNLPKSEIGQIEDRLKGVGDELGNLVKGGGGEAAAKTFNQLADSFTKAGGSAQDALNYMPAYRDALLEQATAAGQTLTPTELLDLAMGKVPASMQAAAGATDTYMTSTGNAAPVTEDMAKQLEDLGIAADGTVVALDKYAAALVRAGLSVLSENDAHRSYLDSLDAVDAALAQNGKTLDEHTAAGRANAAAIDAVASAGLGEITAMAGATDAMGNHIHTSDDLSGKMHNTYDDLMANYDAFNVTGDAADTLARKTLGIPKGVDIDTWMHDHASELLDQVAGKANALDGKQVHVGIYTTEYLSTVDNRSAPTVVDPNKLGGHYQTGGEVNYLANGGTPIRYAMVPRGTDTVPAMLTPGEFVVNRRATSENLALLRGINNGSVRSERSNAFAGAPGSTLAGSSNVIEHHYHIDAKPGLASMYAQEIADQAVTRARDFNAAYGINRIR